MSGKIKVFILVLMGMGVALLGFLALQQAEAAKPSGDIQLRATIWNSTGAGVVGKIHNDGLGEYVSGEALAGSVNIYIDERYGYARFYIDKGTNPSVNGRSVSLFFDDPVVGKPVMWMDTCPDELSFSSIVPQIFAFRISYLFSQDPLDPTLLHQEAPAGLDFRTMGITVTTREGTVTYPAQAYAGMVINFWIDAGGDQYNVGGQEYAVKVTALEFNGPNGAPSHWKIESLRPPMHKDDAEDDDRTLYHSWEGTSPDMKGNRTRTLRCGYAWFHFPFEIDLYRK
jgi:hypothetical protein